MIFHGLISYGFFKYIILSKEYATRISLTKIVL